ncbi:MAG TPA: M28 family metallopeptidase [Gemmatimonadales bacterium]|nr:M28 family metallopeptidase [Gemmatimonadales bacterium]
MSWTHWLAHRPRVLLPGVIALAVFGTSCSFRRDVPGVALESINAADMAQYVKVLSSDRFGGRGPSSPGEDSSINFIRAQFVKLGLRPGNDTSYFQAVPLVRSTVTDTTAALDIRGKGIFHRFHFGTDYIAWTKRVADTVGFWNAPMVFVGYGIVAPEYHWNDYAGVDAHGKVVVMLVNDPGYATQDTALFRGNTMTYYGRWTYKFEEAARQGAIGALIIHETGAAGYPWTVVRNSWSGPQFELEAADSNASRAAVEGWLTDSSAQALFQQAGLDLDQEAKRAARPGFTAVPLELYASTHLDNAIQRSVSHNVLGVLPGTDHRNEYLIYTAHWDHFGTDSTLTGDQIFNGARDNATGVAALIELAKAFKALGTPPARSVLFLAVTAEERGLLGSEYYAEHPVYPLNETVADINMDAMNIFGPTHDIVVVGLGNSQLDEYVEEAAKEQGRVVRPDAEPQKGYYYRSDHFSFAKVGVPALDPNVGVDNVDHGEAWGRAQLADYTEHRYHTPADEYSPSWDLRGMVQDVRLLFRVGYRLVMSHDFPDWRPGVPFKALRDSMMQAAQ